MGTLGRPRFKLFASIIESLSLTARGDPLKFRPSKGKFDAKPDYSPPLQGGDAIESRVRFSYPKTSRLFSLEWWGRIGEKRNGTDGMVRVRSGMDWQDWR